ncbi:MAG TPA: hypothetical protein VFZ22_14015 [Pyrinomonadaceae bacterium]|nr:hypothetical protein [Pyrinomonadaceae bacterium]
MNSVGQSGDKKSYRVILLLVVGLAAFSSAMKELNQVREFTREATDLVASLSKAVEPAPADDRVAPVEVPRTAARLEVCENSHPAVPVVAVPEPMARQDQPGGGVAQEEPAVQSKDVGKTFVAERSSRREVQAPAVGKSRSVDIDIVELRRQARRAADLKVLMMADKDGEAEISVPPDLQLQLPKVKALRQFKVGTKEHDIFIKSLNRSINVRSAG